MTTDAMPGHPEDGNAPTVAPLLKLMEDVDEALLAEAQRLLGTGSAIATINQALAEMIKERRRQDAAEAQLRRFGSGQFAALPIAGEVR